MTPTIQEITSRVAHYWPAVDHDAMERAWKFASEAHDGQLRKNGEPFIVHPLNVAYILTEIQADPSSVMAGLLHDTVEDTAVTTEDIAELFGPSVAKLVEGVTKLSKLNFRTEREEQARNLRKMFLAMSDDIRVIVIKLADRLHNMRTLASLAPDRQQSIALETRMIFAPLAHRLGVWRIKWELEDYALRYLEPDEYFGIVDKIGKTRVDREKEIETARQQLGDRLRQGGIQAEVYGRPKHIFSIYHKMRAERIDFDQIGDLMALRVLTNTVGECYAALGVVHDLWMPLQGLFTDYIAKPKSNKYQSLHTKVLGPDNGPMEVQIRTYEMHRVAEYGVAAHWRYKEGSDDPELDAQVGWMRGLLDLETDLKESHEFVELLELDLFRDQVFVFTPQGDVIDLPVGATPVDFAYRVHTEVGHHCAGAKVNGRLVSLEYRFVTGDVAEIVTNTSAQPSRDWLNFAQSQHARAKIRRWLRQKTKDESIELGRESIEREIDHLKPADRARVQHAKLADVALHLNYPNVEGLYAGIGYGDVEPATVLRHLLEPGAPASLAEEVARFARPPSAEARRKHDEDAGGVKGFHSRLSMCCNPLPGDDIVAYVTRGGGLAVHRADCKNLLYRKEREPDRVLPMSWDNGKQGGLLTDVEVTAIDRVGLFSHITAVVADLGLSIHSAQAHLHDEHVARINLTVEVKDRRELDDLITHLRQLIDVISVRPLTGSSSQGS